MNAGLHVDEAVRIHRAETRWLDQCAVRLRRATLERRLQTSVDTREVSR
ncbi:hypothetical protein [Nocardioides ungokensis]|nr:hypothetical protein [Nocardioides ungokensis]